MSLGLGARPLGMGGAFVAVSDDATAPYWNPAGGVQGEGKELFGMHSESFGSIVKLDGIAYLQSSGSRGALGLYFTRLGVEGIAITDSTGKDPNFPIEITNRVNAEDLLFALTYAQMQGKTFSLGGSVKFVRRDTGTNTALGTGVDIGGLFWLKEGITIGVNLQDLTTTIITWDTGQKDYILPTVKTGIALKKNDLLIALDVDLKFENRGKEASQFTFGRGSGDLHLGMEYLIQKGVVLRTGFNLGRFTMGGGIRYKSLTFDLALLDRADLGGSTRVSGSINF